MHQRALLLVLFSLVAGFTVAFARTETVRGQQTQPAQQRLVEDVQIEGNRRNRDEDLLYFLQTRQGDPYNEQQVQRDLQSLLSLGFFDKTATKVQIADGPRGGVIVIFTVKELPIIRDIDFKGLKSITESDVLKAFRERRVGVSKESSYDPVKVNNAKRVIRELLAARGHPNATVEVKDEEVSQTSIAVTFDINEGERVRVAEIQFEGNQVFSDKQLRKQMKYVKEAGLISRFKSTDILDTEKLDKGDLQLIQNYMRSKGYLQARTGEPRVESLGRRRMGFFLPLPLLSSEDDALRVTIPVVEGKLYRIGEIKIEGNSIFSEQVIRSVVGLQKGDVADGEKIGKALNESLKKLYGSQGFIQYSYEVEPTFKDNPNAKEGTVDFKFIIDEGKQFTLRRLEFVGNTFTRDDVLRREMLLNEGDIFNQAAFELSILRLNQLGYFDPIDKEKDADYRTNEEEALVDANIKVTERGRQQISFNGGVSGIGGSFFGLEYSTNNLLGRGETLSFNLAAGNRQRSFVFSFTEPYIRNRPITAGFTIFSQSLKFFGPGTFLSQNVEAQQGLFGSVLDFLNVGEENLFTQDSTGASIFVSAPLSEFYRKRPFTQLTRIGLSYSISRTSVKDPEVNRQNNQQTFIPVLYRQPDILTSRITGSIVYDNRDYATNIDPKSGREIRFALGLAGLGGDVRTYSPSASYTQYIPVRRKKEKNPEVFAFRILAGHIGSFSTTAKVREANQSSLAFIGGTPIFERFFLGDEFTIRGYNVRSIGPISPVDTFVTSRNVVVASNASGTPTPIEGLQNLASIGVFTGATGSNPALLSRSFTSVGGDTQLLANLEYRIPLFGPVSVAAFADIGSAFNLRKVPDQTFSTNFLADQPFLSSNGFIACRNSFVTPVTLNSLVACQARPDLAFIQETGALLVRNGQYALQTEYDTDPNPVDPATGLKPGYQAVFLRGEAQNNTVVRLSQSSFSKFSDYRSSLGLELRIQVPVVNVPFRLIYAYNPNARRGVFNDLPTVFFNEKKSVFRFSIGRTF